MPYVETKSSRTWGFPCHDIALYVVTVGARHCVAARLCACDSATLSQQCGIVLHRDIEGYARGTDQVRRARM